jgi:signal transduction histidine kinase
MAEDVPGILIVDDTPEKLVALESILVGLPVRIVKVTSGRDALRRLLIDDFAVILLDIRMPVMDGFETAALIRQRPRSAQTPIIFITAFGDETHVTRGYSLRAVDYIMTPVLPEVLRTKVSIFVDLFTTTARVRQQAESLRRHAVQLRRLTTASLAIHSAPGVESIVDATARSARDVLEAARAVVTAHLDERRNCTARAGHAGDEAEDAVAEVVTRTNRLYRARRNVHEVVDGTDGADAAELDVLAVPLLSREGRNMGVVQVSRSAPSAFEDQDEDLLLQLAQMASVAIENALFSEAREANRLKDEFIATVSHELRTPLNALRSWTYVLRNTKVNAEKRARALEAIDRNVGAQARIVDDLLDVSRIVTGKLKLDCRLLDLVPIVEGVLEAHVAAAEAKGLVLVRDVEAVAGLVSGDAERLQQVITNLLSNAIKFTPSRGRIQVTLRRAGTDVRVSVSDTGQGIRRDFLPHVFERFRQADASATRNSGGLGLGLAIVRHLVELHGGTVGVESEGEGRGATFAFSLPVASLPVVTSIDSRAADVETLAGGAALDGLHVLVVEDEPDTREAIALMITEAGGRASAVGTTADALRAIPTLAPDVLVCDIGLPGEDGYSLIRKVRALDDPAAAAIPAIALTAYAQETDRRRALAAGFQSHLAKPVQPARLLGMLATAAAAHARSGATHVADDSATA